MAYTPYQIKSFKHDGHLHRIWLENWLVPAEFLHPEHADENMIVLVNSHTKIREADGKEWVSRIPGISFFIPKQWYNIVALIEETGIRYYCNIASPPYATEQAITYIDYDLDVIVTQRGDVHVVDQEEYEVHQQLYHYSDVVKARVKEGLDGLLKRVRHRWSPFHSDKVLPYYELWKKQFNEV